MRLKQISALFNRAESLVLAGVLVPIDAKIVEKCNSQKSFEQEKNFHFKNLLFQCKIFILRARQATYNQLPLEELKTMNFIQSILNFFGRRETKRQGKYSYELRKDLKAEQERLLRIINKENTRANLRAYKNQMTWIGNKEGKL